MNQPIPSHLPHGYLILFAVVLVEQLGLPIPAVPVLLAMGALAGLGNYSLPWILLTAVLASLAGDLAWFELGRHRGRSVVRRICGMSLEPDYCVRRTEMAFSNFGSRTLLFAKFLPGLSTVAPPLAAMLGMDRVRFILWDGTGALLWAATFIGAGVMFSRQLGMALAFAARFGSASIAVAALTIVVFLTWKYVQRQRFLRHLRVSRITPDELLSATRAADGVFVLDLRDPVDLRINPTRIKGALWMALDDVGKRHHEIPRDRDVALYCNCPNEATSASVALMMRRLGIVRVRPLAGGFEAWRLLGYPVEPVFGVPRLNGIRYANFERNE